MSQIVAAVALILGLKSPPLKIEVSKLEKSPISICWSTEDSVSPRTPRRQSPVNSILRTHSFSMDRTEISADRVPYGERSEEDES